MKDKPHPPWWFELFPDVRAWATLGMFAMVAYILHLIATVPRLADNELFKTATILVLGTGGFGLLAAFLWGGSKASVAAAETVNEMARQSPSAAAVTSTGQTVAQVDIAAENVSVTEEPKAG